MISIVICRDTKQALKILSHLNGLGFDEVKEQYHQYIDNIMDFSIDVVEIDEEYNPEFNCIDLFLRLNTKPFPIEPNSFEMWNAYVLKSITENIKRIAKTYDGKILRANNARMANEELITTLAYLDFKKVSGTHFKDLLSVYIRNESVSTRIASKSRVTKILEGIDSSTIDKFVDSVEKVNLFFAKISKLVEDDGKNFHDLTGTSQKTAQNFYFLWIMLENITEDFILANTTKVYEHIIPIRNLNATNHPIKTSS